MKYVPLSGIGLRASSEDPDVTDILLLQGFSTLRVRLPSSSRISVFQALGGVR